MNVIYTFFSFLFLFSSYAIGEEVSKSCNVDESVIRNNSAVRNFEQEIFKTIDVNNQKIIEGKQAAIELEDAYMSGELTPDLGTHLTQKRDEGIAAEEVEKQRSGRCNNKIFTYKMVALNKIRELCRPDEAKAACQPWVMVLPKSPNNQANDDLTFSDKGMSKRGGISKTLQEGLGTLTAAYEDLSAANRACDSKIQETLMSDSCRSAYDMAFYALPRQEIAEKCELGEVQTLSGLVAGAMVSFAKDSCDLMSTYASNKSKERMVYNRMQKFKQSIACVNHIDPEYCREQRSGRAPASDGRPQARPPGF